MATGGCFPDADVNKLTCAVCLEQYRRPKLLPCFHTFCQSCLQAVAGPSPEFPCPACRNPVLLPPGGVAALQTNFYIEQDLGTDSTPTVRLCDVCTEDREATHTCLQCQQRYCLPCRRIHNSITSSRSHTVVSLQPDDQDDENLKGDLFMKEREEFCLKHRNQPVIIHCTACKSNICMQCKLTSHEGHPTEDLADTGAKVKARLRDKLEIMVQNKRSIEGLLYAFDEKRRRLQSVHESTEQEIRNRRDTIRQWADECQENALKTLHSLGEELLTSLNAAEEDAEHKQAAVSAQYDHATRVLVEDKDTDIVLLEDQLKEVTVDDREVSQLLASLEKKFFTCEHDPASVNTTLLQAYIGIMKNSASTPETVSFVVETPLSPATPAVTAVSAKQHARVTEVSYSPNPDSTIVAICSTSQKRVWIKYQQGKDCVMMGLFGVNGQLESLDNVFKGNSFITLSNDITLGGANCPLCCWIQLDGTMETAQTKFSVCGVPKYAAMSFLATIFRQSTFQICHCAVTSIIPLNWTNTTLLNMGSEHKAVRDVSSNGRYIALINTSEYSFQLDLYENVRSGSLRHISSYTPVNFFGIKQKVLDACFFPLDGKEFLLVVVEGDNNIHVVDHINGSHVVHYLNTGPVKIKRPYCLATDQENVLWIGCHGGKAVLMEI